VKTPIPLVGFTRAASCSRCGILLPMQPAYGYDRRWPHLYCSATCLEAVSRELRAIAAALHGKGSGGAL